MYINRNQIGAIVGSQPFGGEGLSGTGPKAGGPFYVKRLVHNANELNGAKQTEGSEQINQNEYISDSVLKNSVKVLLDSKSAEFGHLMPLSSELSQQYLGLINRCRHELRDTSRLPGPTGEDNLLSLNPQGLTLIATQDSEIAFQQAIQALYCGNSLLVCNANFNSEQQDWLIQHPNVVLLEKGISPQQLTDIQKMANFVYTASTQQQFELAREYRIALAKREGAIIRFIDDVESPYLYAHERHLCINTTAAGGNVELIANSE